MVVDNIMFSRLVKILFFISIVIVCVLLEKLCRWCNSMLVIVNSRFEVIVI